MSATPLFVLMQPKISNSYWVANILSGIDRALLKYHDRLCILDAAGTNGLSDPIYNLYKQPVLLIGSDVGWIDRSINMLLSYEAIPILVNGSMLPIHKFVCSGVVFELEEALNYCKEYLRGYSRERIAFLGAHSHSASDIAKSLAFGDSENTYSATSTIESCVDSFLEAMPSKKYNGIICANDTVAIYLINKMKALGYDLPRDCYVIGMGDSCLGANHTISVTSVTFDYTQMGEQAVNLYHTVAKAPSPCHHTVSLPCCLIVRESTGGGEAATGIPIRRQVPFEVCQEEPDNYFMGEYTQKILELEAILQKCDQADKQIIFGMMRGEGNERIAERVYLTPRAVRYRINNLFKRQITMTQDEFFAALANILM